MKELSFFEIGTCLEGKSSHCGGKSSVWGRLCCIICVSLWSIRLEKFKYVKKNRKIEIITALVFIAIGVLLHIIMEDKWFLGTIFLAAGVSYFACIPIDNYYAKKKKK